MGVREGLLSLLDDGPRHGYQLKTSFEGSTGGIWPLNVGQVYTTLDRLVRDGLVTVLDVAATGDEAPGQKTYTITDDGRSALGDWWEAVPLDEPPPRDELLLKVLMAIHHGHDHALAVLTRQRTAIFGRLQQHRRASRRGDPADVAGELVGDALTVRAEADLRWLDLCEAKLLAERNH